MVTLYAKTATAFNDNGLCVLSPTVCAVHEVAGGTYELHMEHPMDSAGKWRLIEDDSLIKAPVPPNHIPQITLPKVKEWRTTASTPFWEKLPVKSKKETDSTQSILLQIKNNPQNYLWSAVKAYNSGAYVYDGTNVYKAIRFSYAVRPGTDSTVWSFVTAFADITGGGSSGGQTITPGVEVAGHSPIAAGTTIYKLADFNEAYIRARDAQGAVGFVARSDCEQTTAEHSGEIIPAQTILTQVFRVYSINCDDAEQKITVDARHYSYDFAGNALYECKIKDAKPADAIALLTGTLMEPDSRRIACNITGKKVDDLDWSYKNPINALLDPEDGLVHALDAKLIRNNADFFLLPNDENDTGFAISYGVNMQGVRWTRSTENVITKILPRCNAADGGYLYLEDLYVVSSKAQSYPVQRIHVLNCPYGVGEEYEKADGTKVTRTEESCREQMQEDAQKMFDEDHVDDVQLTLDVEFVLLGDTVEYQQYHGLQQVNLYDTITVNTGISGVTAKAVVNEYEWDCLTERYVSIILGTVSSFNQRVPGYRIRNQSITYNKLSPDIIQRIITANASSSSDSGSIGGSPTGGGFPVQAEVTVSDNNPSLAWGQQSTVGTVQGTALHVKMPSNPAPSVVDNLNSTSTTAALSANQGRVLAEQIDGKQATLHYVDRTVRNIQISSDNGYASVGTLSDFGLTNNNYIVNFFIRGWSGAPGTVTLLAATNGQTIYAMCAKAGTITSLTIRLWYY